MSDKLPVNIERTIHQIKAFEPGMYVTYRVPSITDGVFFMYRRELIALATGYERFEKALSEIRVLSGCDGGCKKIAEDALKGVLGDEVEEDGSNDIYQRMLNNDWEDVGCLDFFDDELVVD